MKKKIIYPVVMLSLLAFSTCDNKTTDQAEAEQQSDHGSEATINSNTTNLSRDEHIRQIKAEEVNTFEGINANAKNSIRKLTGQYLKLKQALIASEASQASEAAANMRSSLQEINGLSLEAAQKDFLEQRSQVMQEQLQKIEASDDLLQQREHFARLSKGTTELVSAFDAGNGTLYYQYCPMAFDNKGGYWISDSKEIRNPYYPKEMLSCGRVAREL